MLTHRAHCAISDGALLHWSLVTHLRQPGLPLKKGRAQTMTHDYKRNGTTTLFAALDVKTGKVIGECLPRHRAKEFLRFLKTIDRTVPKHLDVHAICDNYKPWGTFTSCSLPAFLAHSQLG